MQLEKQHQNQTVPSHRVVATCRLPWHFKVGKRQVGQGIPTVSARGTVPPQNGPSGTSGQQGDTATPRPNGRAGPGLPIQDIQSSPASSTLSEGEPPVVPLPSPNPTPVRRPDTNVVPEPLQRKRRRNEAGLDDGDPQAITAERHVRPRLDPGNNAIPGPSANHSRSGPSTTAAETGATQRPTPHDIPPLNGSSTSPPTSATPSTALPDTPRMEPGPFTPQLPGQNSHSQPIESNVAILRVTNPRTGPVSGNMEIWLLGEHLPTAFTLYARFGTNVTATVSFTLHLLLSSDLRIRRFRMRLCCPVYFPPRVMPAVSRLHYHVHTFPGALNMEAASLSSRTVTTTPQCEFG